MKKILFIVVLLFLTACSKVDKLDHSYYELNDYKVKNGELIFKENDIEYKVKLDKTSEGFLKLAKKNQSVTFDTDDIKYKKSDDGILLENVDLLVKGINPFKYKTLNDYSYEDVNRFILSEYQIIDDRILVNRFDVDYYFKVSEEVLNNINKPSFPSKDKNDLVLAFNEGSEVVKRELEDYYTISNTNVEVDMSNPFTPANSTIKLMYIDGVPTGHIIHNGCNYLFDFNENELDLFESGTGYGLVYQYGKDKPYTDNIKRTITIDGEVMEYYKIYDQDFIILSLFE